MRQAGVLAAAGLHALDHHVDRLADDHARAARLAESVGGLPGVSVDRASVESNMVYVDVSGTGMDAPTFVSHLDSRGVKVVVTSATHLRAVTHLDVDDRGLEAAEKAFAEVAGAAQA